MAETLDLSRIEVAPDKHAVFVITFPGRLRVEQAARIAEAWKAAWEKAGREQIPPMLVLDSGCDIKSLTNEGLKHLGLVRMSEPDEVVI